MSEAKLPPLIEAKNYYEYQQLVKSIFYKYKIRKRIGELKALVSKALKTFLEHQQTDLLADLFTFYYIDHAKKEADYD